MFKKIASFIVAGIFWLPAAAQPDFMGVVWQIPDLPAVAVQDLNRMSSIGINAVRTSVIADTVLFAHADSLGIVFFQDLPLHYLPSEIYADSLTVIIEQVRDSVAARGLRYRSARYIGLSVKSDTSVPQTCDSIENAARQLRAMTANAISTYYVTNFASDEKCKSGQSFIIYDRITTARLLSSNEIQVPAGITIGHQVMPGRTGGWRHTLAEEQQARRIENDLAAAFASPFVRAVFIDRWADNPSIWGHDADAIKRKFGIVGPGGIPLEAFDVVQGFYTGRQLVFAIDAGSRRAISGIWLPVLGWMLVGLLALAYASSPQMRQMAPRYFMSHGFFRESVAEGRDAIPVASLIMLLAVAVSAGLIGTVVVSHFGESRFMQALLYTFPETVRTIGVLFIGEPFLLCTLIACLYALFMTSWTSLLSFWSRFGKTLLLPWQTLLLVVWPRWPILLIMLAALSIAAGKPTDLEILLICAATILSAVHAIYRTLNDYRLTAEMSLLRLLVPTILNPTLLLVLALMLLIATNTDTAEFLVHVLRRN